jgi:hypothetical protein
VEKFFKDEFDVTVAFDIKDGCDHLRKLGLLIDHDGAPAHFLELDAAYNHLVESWKAIPTQHVFP